MRYSEIKLEQREVIEQIRKKYGHYLLAHAFGTLLLWKETLGLSVYVEEDFFSVKCDVYGEHAYFFPCGCQEKKIQFIKAHMEESDFVLYYLDPRDKRLVETYFRDSLYVEYDRGGCEYIFDKSKHILRQGKEYAKIRYEQNHLKARYRLQSEPLTTERIEEASKIIKGWGEEHQGRFNDFQVALNALKYFESMGFIGNIVYADDIPSAVAVGCPVTEDTYGIQIAKMHQKREGMMFYLLEKCFELIPEQYIYINGDDDMNIEGIRIHKQKMRPCKMNKVWRVIRR